MQRCIDVEATLYLRHVPAGMYPMPINAKHYFLYITFIIEDAPISPTVCEKNAAEYVRKALFLFPH